MINVLFHSNYPHAKMGGQKSLIGLIENLDREKFNPMLVVHESGELAEILKNLGVKTLIFKFPGNKPKNFFKVRKSIKQFSNILTENKIDIVHSDNDKFIYLASKSAKKADSKSIYHARVTSKRRYDQLLERNVDQIVGISNGVKGRFGKKTLNSKFIKIYNGLDCNLFSDNYDQNKIQEKLNLDPSKINLLFVGQIKKGKGLDEVLSSAEKLNSDYPGQYYFYLLGDELNPGKLRYYKSMSEKMNLSKCVFFMGQRENVNEWMQAADILLFPSHEGVEGMGRVPMEAMATATPVIATNISGVNEAVSPEVGILIDEKDVKQLTDAILHLSKNKELRNKMGTNGRKRALELFDIKVHAENMMNLFEKMVDENEN